MQRPQYDKFAAMDEKRGPIAEAFARQIIETARPWLPKPIDELDVLDVGSGYGHTAAELGKACRSVLGIEPAEQLHAASRDLETDNVNFRHLGVEGLSEREAFDLVVLDNVFEHLPDQASALDAITRSLRPGGVLYLLTPNRLWPIEAHYKLPGLAWLPLPLANRYLRASGRGTDYTDASYAPTYWQLGKALRAHPELEWSMTLPGDRSATSAGSPPHYRLGMAALDRWPILWSISKALLVVAVKKPVRLPSSA